MRGHMANLDRQTAPHRRIYVFDEADQPPDWLTGEAITAREPLTIYQAWNMALSQVRTPYVMNLNLDDRLALDGIEQLVRKIESNPDIYLVGGDWKICGTAEETDDVGQAYPLDRLPFTPVWPPTLERPTRLGSGNNVNTDSYGPACLWRMDAHKGLPRYPYRFEDGTLIRMIGDAVWWLFIREYAHKRIERVPMVIGNYRTWPTSQAEFRNRHLNERDRRDFSIL
jgi:hypothetical protein